MIDALAATLEAARVEILAHEETIRHHQAAIATIRARMDQAVVVGLREVLAALVRHEGLIHEPPPDAPGPSAAVATEAVSELPAAPAHVRGEGEPCDRCGRRLPVCECPAGSEVPPAPVGVVSVEAVLPPTPVPAPDLPEAAILAALAAGPLRCLDLTRRVLTRAHPRDVSQMDGWLQRLVAQGVVERRTDKTYALPMPRPAPTPATPQAREPLVPAVRRTPSQPGRRRRGAPPILVPRPAARPCADGPSWWIVAPREGFSALADHERERMASSPEARHIPSPVLD